MDISEKYLQKNGVALTKLAREMMTFRSGERIPTISDFVERYHVSRGTVQAALKFLCQQGVDLRRQGHMGSYVEFINYEKVWHYTGWNALVGVMPLPVIDSLRGLATAIDYSMNQAGLPFRQAFMQSAENRVHALAASRFDFVIVSKLTAEICLEAFEQLEIALEFLDGSYCRSNVFAFYDPKETEIRDGMRIAYDPLSPDQSYLTRLFCGDKNVTLLSMPYRSTLRCLEQGDVDAVIYREESVLSSPYPLGSAPIPDESLTKKGLQAVILTNKENYWIKELLQKALNPKQILSLQKQVEAGAMVSYY